MDAQAINSTFYRMAVNSMTSDNQQIMYYKSELSGNYWKDISSASGLEYILPSSDNVEEASLSSYYVSIVVGEDGIPRWAKTGNAADIFAITDPYELENLPELRALKLLFDSGTVTSSDSGSKNYIYYRIKEFFKADGNYTRSSEVETGVKYALDVSTRTGIAFYAPDYHKTNYSTASEERWLCYDYWWRFSSTVSRHRSGIGISETGGLPRWRFEESGAGFLESLETLATAGSKPRFNFYYSNGSAYYPWSGSDQDAKLIRGGVSWKNEVAWRSEVNNFGGISELRKRLWNFETVFQHFSCVHDDTTDDLDRKLRNMGNIYSDMRSGGTDEDAELSDEILLIEEKLDAARRYEAYYNLIENEDQNYIFGPPLNLLYQWVSYGESSVGRNYNIIYYTDEDFTSESSITAAVEQAITECASSMYSYQALARGEGTTILSQTEYKLEENVINNAANGTSAVRADLVQLVDLENISNNVISHKSRELNLLNDTLLPTADVKFASYVHESAGEAYTKAASDPDTTESTLDEILKDQKADVSAVAAELQRFIKAKAMRISTDDAISFIYERIDWAESLRSGISTADFGTYATEALEEHIAWLKLLLQTVKDGGALTDEESDWSGIIGNLEKELLDELDNGDLDSAESTERKLADAQGNMDEAESSGRSVISDPDAASADVDGVTMPDTPTGVADEIAQDTLAKIGNGEYDTIPDDIGALEALGYPDIGKITDALRAHDAPAELINQALEAEENVSGSEFAERYSGKGAGDTDVGTGDSEGSDGGTGGSGTSGASGEGSGSSSGSGEGSGNTAGGDLSTGSGAITGDGTGLEEDDFDNAINEALGDDFDNLSPEDKAAAVAAVIDFAKARDDGAAYDYAIDLLQNLLDINSAFIYRQYLDDTSQEYVSLAAVSRCRRYTRFRLVQKDRDVTMSQIAGGSASYIFRIGKDTMTKSDGDKITLEKSVVSQEDESLYGNKTAKYPYISEADSGRYLYNTCAYIPGTEWAVLITPQTDKKITQLLDTLDLYADGE